MPLTASTRARAPFLGNTTPRLQATPGGALGVLAAFAVALSAPTIRAVQPAQTPASWRLGAQAPSPQQVLDVYRVLRESLTTWTAPQARTGDTSRACFVSIRLEGREIGSGQGWPATEQDPVRESIDAALRDAAEHAPIARDALREQRLRELAPLLSLSVELALPPAPIEIESLESLDAVVLPGLEGVAVERDGRVAAVSAGQMLASGQSPSEAARGAIARLLGSAALSLERWPTLRQKYGLTILKFRTVHAAQPAAGAEPVFLERGARLVYLTDIDSIIEMRAWTDDLARALLRRVEGASFHAGAYRLDRGEWEDDDHADRALLAALALDRLVRLPEADVQAATRQAAQRALDGLLEQSRREPPGATISAFRLLIGRGSVDERAGDARRVQAALAAPGAAPPAVRAMWVCGIAGVPEAHEAARSALNDLIRTPDAGAALEAWPWLPWAAIRLSDEHGDVPASGLIRESRAVLESHRLTAITDAQQPDLVGGVVIGAGPPWPTWTTARLSAALPAMLTDQRLTPKGEAPGAIMALVNALRFLRQLTADESTGWMCRSPALARGMVRLAPWEVRGGCDAQSLTLIMLCDTLEAMPKLRPKPPGGAPAPTPAR